ncbi:MAG: sigma-70 family RNA polymerase sigma factor [Pirellulales bacterium]|nr:sigma-70 family RNA polymerase sigma factor [Pirellulales bacterium]
MTSEEPQPGGFSHTDRSLLKLVRGGDEDAATELYERYARRVFGLVESQLGDRLRASTEPEDVVQSVFKSMFRGVQSGHYDAPPGTTLWNLLAVIAVHKLRRKAGHLSAQRRDSKRNVPLESVEGTVPIDQSSVEFLQISVRETLELLRPIDRDILSLRIQRYTVDEISEETGRSRRTVERSLQRSRERLASLLLDGQ